MVFSRPEPEFVIDLVSDEDSSILGDPDKRTPPPQLERFINIGGAEAVNGILGHHGARPFNNANSPIDLTGPDTPRDNLTPSSEPAGNPMSVVENQDLFGGELMTEAACVQLFLDVLPGISLDHVLELLRTNTDDFTRTPTACERIIAQLVESGEYPKEQDMQTTRKRKRPEEEELSQFEKGVRSEESSSYHRDALALLCDVFPYVPQRHIEIVLRAHRTLFKAYGVIEDDLCHYNDRGRKRTFVKCIRKRGDRGTEALLVIRGSAIPKELHAAKQKSEAESAKRSKAEEEREAEEANLQHARTTGALTECQCCFDEIPTNRVTCCTGSRVHFFCKPCAKTYVETELGSGRCRPVCFADPDCGGKFLRRELLDFLSEKSFERLEHMQQQEDLAAAGLDFLSECPFCDYKAECLPVEVDKEFRCMNPRCQKISCRFCNRETHVPLSCEEAKKDESVSMRHIVEEAMSAALIRHCNKCKHAFVKEFGCNKMTCSHCRNLQCYVCSKNVTGYDHFKDGRSDTRGGKCPLHDNVEARHEAEVKKAADEALAKVQSEHPDFSPADLMVQVSENVKRMEEARRDRAQAPPHLGNVAPRRNGRPENWALGYQMAQMRGAQGQLPLQQGLRQVPIVQNPGQYVFQPPNPVYQQHAPPVPPGLGQEYLAAPDMAVGWPPMAVPNIQPPPQPMFGPPELLYFPMYQPEPPNQQ